MRRASRLANRLTRVERMLAMAMKANLSLTLPSPSDA